MAKVKIKQTGEVMDFAPNSLVAVHRPGTSEHDDIEYNINEVEIIPDGDNARIEFAKAAMQSLLLRGGMASERLAKRAFEIADAMIKQFNKV
jgi:hypothetical protein